MWFNVCFATSTSNERRKLLFPQRGPDLTFWILHLILYLSPHCTVFMFAASQSRTRRTHLYLQAKVLGPLLQGRGDRSLGLPQGLRALLPAAQQTRVPGGVDGPPSERHLGGQSGTRARGQTRHRAGFQTRVLTQSLRTV